MQIENELKKIIKDLNNINKFFKNNPWLQLLIEIPTKDKIKELKPLHLNHEKYLRNRGMNHSSQLDLDNI